MRVRVKQGKVSDVALTIFEPPRFFEAFLRGRQWSEAPDITARICGICPVAYQMSAVHAMEDAFGVAVGGPIRDLRRLLYCGEWIESHVLHVAMLHAPDFLGYESAIHMAKDHRGVVERALEMKKIGNEIMTVVGGREIHPINVRAGGFYKTPSRRDLAALAPRIRWALEGAIEMTRWTSGFDFPDFTRDYEFVALRHPDEYPMNEGRIVSSRGLDIGVREYEDYFEERQVAHSMALHSTLKARGAYFVGPLARYALNFDRLSPAARDAARASGIGAECRNPFQSIVVRSVETVLACEEALAIIARYEPPDAPAVAVTPRAGIGRGCTEAPRGILFHRYEIDSGGRIVSAKITPPTAQNQTTIEDDLREFAQARLDLPDERLTWECEQAIRNYDPCISCATHYLKLEVVRA